MLTKFIQTKKSAWEDYLDTCVYAYNTAVHESSRFTPYKLMFGRKAVLPIDLEVSDNAGDLILEYADQQQQGYCHYYDLPIFIQGFFLL